MHLLHHSIGLAMYKHCQIANSLIFVSICKIFGTQWEQNLWYFKRFVMISCNTFFQMCGNSSEYILIANSLFEKCSIHFFKQTIVDNQIVPYEHRFSHHWMVNPLSHHYISYYIFTVNLKNWRWFSAGWTFFTFKTRITESTSHRWTQEHS